MHPQGTIPYGHRAISYVCIPTEFTSIPKRFPAGWRGHLPVVSATGASLQTRMALSAHRCELGIHLCTWSTSTSFLVTKEVGRRVCRD